MSEMVERVARAMEPDVWASIDGDVFPQKERARRNSLDRARAAIEAMREPTEAMLNTLSSSEAWDSYDRGMAKAQHMMMIGAALKD